MSGSSLPNVVSLRRSVRTHSTSSSNMGESSGLIKTTLVENTPKKEEPEESTKRPQRSSTNKRSSIQEIAQKASFSLLRSSQRLTSSNEKNLVSEEKSKTIKSREDTTLMSKNVELKPSLTQKGKKMLDAVIEKPTLVRIFFKYFIKISL